MTVSNAFNIADAARELRDAQIEPTKLTERFKWTPANPQTIRGTLTADATLVKVPTGFFKLIDSLCAKAKLPQGTYTDDDGLGALMGDFWHLPTPAHLWHSSKDIAQSRSRNTKKLSRKKAA